jgi:hypothetical protein
MMKTNRFTKLCWTIGHALGIVPRDELRKTVGCILHSDTHFLGSSAEFVGKRF